MAFNTNNTQASASTNNNWKADAFINFSVPRKDGTAKKLGALSLKCDRDEETATLVAWLAEDPARVQKLMEKMIIDFRLAKTDHRVVSTSSNTYWPSFGMVSCFYF